MSSPARLQTPAGILITILNGPDKGATFRATSNVVSIGREAGNDIVIKDNRASRRHALLEIQDHGVLIKDLESKTGIVINGETVRQASLAPGVTFKIGETKIQITPEGDQEPALPVDQAPAKKPSRPSSFSPMIKPSKRTRLYSIIAVILFLAYLFSTLNSNKQKSQIRTEEDVKTEIDQSQKRKQALIQAQVASGKNTRQYQDAQADYIIGFREYREGNYFRAISYFQSALALYPNHELAARYLRISQRRTDELVQVSLFEGRRYMEQNKYQLAISAFKNVMVMLPTDSNSPAFREAKEKYDECELLLSSGGQ